MYSFIFTLGLGQPADSRNSEMGRHGSDIAGTDGWLAVNPQVWNNIDRVNTLIPVFSGALASL